MKNVECENWSMVVIKVLQHLKCGYLFVSPSFIFSFMFLSFFDVFLVYIGQCSCVCLHVLV